MDIERMTDLMNQVIDIIEENDDDFETQARSFGMDPEILSGAFNALVGTDESVEGLRNALPFAFYLGILVGREER